MGTHVEGLKSNLQKMGKEKTLSDSQLHQKNQEALAWFMKWTCGGTVITWIFVLLGWRVGAFKWLTIFGTIVQGVCYRWISAQANSGIDITKGAENTQDVIFITAAIQVASTFSTLVWWLWLVIPCIGIYKIWVGYIWPWITYGPEAHLTDEDRKRMAKKQKKQERRKVVYGR